MTNEATQMGSLPSTPAEDRLAKAIWYSIGFHVVLFTFFSLRAYFSPETQFQFENVIRVDIVGLPDKVAKLPPIEEPKPVAPPKELPKPDSPKVEEKKQELPKPIAAQPKPEIPKINLERTKKDQSAALKRLEALEKLQKAVKSEDSAFINTKVASATKPPPIKGNQVSNGASLKGIAKLNYQNYNDKIHEHIHRFWNLPQWMANANLSAVVIVFIDANGNILKKNMVRSSGRPEFDERAMHAIESSAPLPAPPSELVDILSVEGMQIEMSPE